MECSRYEYTEYNSLLQFSYRERGNPYFNWNCKSLLILVNTLKMINNIKYKNQNISGKLENI